MQPSVLTALEVVTALDGAILTPLSTKLQPITIVRGNAVAGDDAATAVITTPISRKEKKCVETV